MEVFSKKTISKKNKKIKEEPKRICLTKEGNNAESTYSFILSYKDIFNCLEYLKALLRRFSSTLTITRVL